MYVVSAVTFDAEKAYPEDLFDRSKGTLYHDETPMIF